MVFFIAVDTDNQLTAVQFIGCTYTRNYAVYRIDVSRLVMVVARFSRQNTLGPLRGGTWLVACLGQFPIRQAMNELNMW